MKGKGKNPFFKNIFGATAEEAMSEVTAVDGTVLSYDGDLAQGTQMNVTVDGNAVPAPEGDYQVEVDGKTYAITLDADGKVASMEEVEAMSEEATQLSEVIKKVVKDANAKFAAQEKRIKQLEDDLKVAQSGEKFSSRGKKTGKEEGDESKTPGWKKALK